MSNATVLTTVNAPYGEKLDGESLALCISDSAFALSKPGHVSVFFGEVSVPEQIAFAASHGISADTLKSAAREFADFSGETYPIVS